MALTLNNLITPYLNITLVPDSKYTWYFFFHWNGGGDRKFWSQGWRAPWSHVGGDGPNHSDQGAFQPMVTIYNPSPVSGVLWGIYMVTNSFLIYWKEKETHINWKSKYAFLFPFSIYILILWSIYLYIPWQCLIICLSVCLKTKSDILILSQIQILQRICSKAHWLGPTHCLVLCFVHARSIYSTAYCITWHIYVTRYLYLRDTHRAFFSGTLESNSSDVTGLTLHAQTYIQKNATLL